MALPFRSSRKSPGPDSLWGIGDSIPTPEATEKGADSGWELWEQANQQQEKRFAPTEPTPEAPPMTPEESRWASTVPADASNVLPPQAGSAGRKPDPAVTLEAALRVSRRNGRICPRPPHWERFAALLPPRKTLQGLQNPPPAVVGPAWKAAPERAKRNSFREQIEWAERVGKLKEVMDFMAALPEEDWLHAGEQ
jgi:hypothetical protein